MLALGYSIFSSFKFLNSDFSVSLYQAVNCCSLSACFVQKSLKVRFAITLKSYNLGQTYKKSYHNGNYVEFFYLVPNVFVYGLLRSSST